MSLLAGVEPNPDFATGSELSAYALNALQANMAILDAASRYGRNATCGNYGEPPENGDDPNALLWRGGFKFVTGVTTLTIVTYSTGVQTGDALRIERIDGAGASATTTSALSNGLQTHTVTISGAGYANDEVVLVNLSLDTTRDFEPEPDGGWAGAFWGNFDIVEAYISPIAPADAWPGVPLFGAISEANLDQLSSAITWLARAIGLRTEPLFQAVVRKEGPYAAQSAPDRHTTVRWRGGITRTNGHTQVRALLRVMVVGSYGAETISLKVNDVVVDTYAVPTTPGEYDKVLRYDASAVAVGAVMRLEVQHTRADAFGTNEQTSGAKSFLSIFRVWSEPATGAIGTLPALVARASTTFGPSGSAGTLQNWLNTLRNQVAAIFVRLSDNAPIWGRQHLYRARYAFDDEQFSFYEPSAVAMTMSRIGAALMVRGKGVNGGYGPGAFEEKRDPETGAYPFTNFKTFAVIDADQVEQQRIWLDSVPGLPPFAPYNLRGVDIFYAGEELLPEQG